MGDLSINNVVNISVNIQQRGLTPFNPSNLALLSNETPGAGFGSAGYKIYTDSTSVADDFGSGTITAKMANAVFAQRPNILANRGYLVVIILNLSETINEAITRTLETVEYFGVISTQMVTQPQALAAGTNLRSNSKILGVVSRTQSDLSAGSYFDTVMDRSFNNIRCLYHGVNNDEDALIMLASYFGRALSTNFSAPASTSTIHLKSLVGVDADPTINQSILNSALAVGADTYVSIAGRTGIFSSGENDFFDNIYNFYWFQEAVRIAGFNHLAQSNSKIPQTEDGIQGFKSSLGRICEQAIFNGFIAPGEWTLSSFFGNQSDFLDAIRQRGYYIYSVPIALQPTVDRENRESPLVNIAIKYAGAIHSSSIVINVNR